MQSMGSPLVLCSEDGSGRADNALLVGPAQLQTQWGNEDRAQLSHTPSPFMPRTPLPRGCAEPGSLPGLAPSFSP